MVCWWLMFSVLQMARHRLEVNWAPLSDVMMSGTPKRATHSSSSTLAHVAADVSATGYASGHRVDRSTMVNRCVVPRAAGSGPTRSTWRWENRRCGTAMGCGSTWTCLVTLPRWHARHCLAHVVTCLARPGHTKREDTSLRVARRPGWASLCRLWKTAAVHVALEA